LFPQQELDLINPSLQAMILDAQIMLCSAIAESHNGYAPLATQMYNGRVGRPRIEFDRDFLEWAIRHRSVSGIAEFLEVSSRTVRRALLDLGLAEPGQNPFPSVCASVVILCFAPASEGISDEELDFVISQLKKTYHRTGLIRWRIVVHGFIDGYSRLVTGLQASDNNRGATVLNLFLKSSV
ncbi:hypothetical protein BDN72DRAFT_747171, partial [Pluteus cervinus]